METLKNIIFKYSNSFSFFLVFVSAFLIGSLWEKAKDSLDRSKYDSAIKELNFTIKTQQKSIESKNGSLEQNILVLNNALIELEKRRKIIEFLIDRLNEQTEELKRSSAT
jgi:septal ring factor EnvC (AmiA/AmiB activator)